MGTTARRYVRPVIWTFLRLSRREVVRARTCVARVAKMRCRHVRITAETLVSDRRRMRASGRAQESSLSIRCRWAWHAWDVRTEWGSGSTCRRTVFCDDVSLGNSTRTACKRPLNVLKPAVSRSHLLKMMVKLEKKIHVLETQGQSDGATRMVGIAAVGPANVRDVKGRMYRGT